MLTKKRAKNVHKKKNSRRNEKPLNFVKSQFRIQILN